MFLLLTTGPLYQPGDGAKALLRPHPAPRHLCAVLWRQLQRHPQEVSQHGGQSLRLPLTVPNPSCELRKSGGTLKTGGGIRDKRWLSGRSPGSSCHRRRALIWCAVLMTGSWASHAISATTTNQLRPLVPERGVKQKGFFCFPLSVTRKNCTKRTLSTVKLVQRFKQNIQYQKQLGNTYLSAFKL